MNVSFGQIRERCEAMKNVKQQCTDGIIDEYFNRRYIKDPITHEKITLDQLIESDMGSDIFITYKRNGDIVMKLKEVDDYKELMGKDSWLKPNDKEPVVLKSRSSLDTIKKQVKNFAIRCRAHAKKYNVLDMWG